MRRLEFVGSSTEGSWPLKDLPAFLVEASLSEDPEEELELSLSLSLLEDESESAAAQNLDIIGF